jgi:polygalacturonase
MKSSNILRNIVTEEQTICLMRYYGTTADGTTDDTDGIQSAIVEAGKVGILSFWNLSMNLSIIQILSGDGSCSILKRFDSINSGTAAVESTGYPIVQIGKVHSDDPRDQVQNISISNHCGDSAFHNKNGNNIEDMRTSIMVRRAKYLDITGCIFSNIDSSAVCFRYPYIINTTKCYNITIRHCRFTGVQPKTTVIGSDGMKRYRALLNAIVCSGVDYLTVSNHFEWCDSCCIGSGTY